MHERPLTVTLIMTTVCLLEEMGRQRDEGADMPHDDAFYLLDELQQVRPSRLVVLPLARHKDRAIAMTEEVVRRPESTDPEVEMASYLHPLLLRKDFRILKRLFGRDHPGPPRPPMRTMREYLCSIGK
jgi:hypothetical protein